MTRRTPFALATAVGLTMLLAACGQSSAGSGTTSPASPTAATSPSPAASPPASGTTSSATAPSSTPPSTSPSSKPAVGAYVSYADYLAAKATYDANGTVVLFFHAGWCPTCKRADRNITADGVPTGLTIVKTDFDSSDDLRQRYGVTVQHTFVQIDPEGKELATFTGSDTAREILDRTV